MRKEKQLLLDDIKEQMETFPSFVVMSYAGLTANAANEFRAEITGLGGSVEMLRKRMLLKAADEVGVSLNGETISGHVSIVFTGEDAIETAKTILKFSKDSGDVLTVLAGRIDGELYTAADVAKLAKLPGKNEMRSQFLGLLEAPMSQTLATMDAAEIHGSSWSPRIRGL